MHEIRALFDKSVIMFESLAEHCSSDSRIISDPHFESAVSKILAHQIMDVPLNLNTHETRCVAHLKATQKPEPADLPIYDAEQEGSEHAEMAALLRSIKRPKVQACSRYMDCRFIRPTSNI